MRTGIVLGKDPRASRWSWRTLLALTLILAAVGLTGVNAEEPEPLVSNVFYETDLREVLLNIADQTGVAIVADATVQGYVTIELENVPLTACLDRLLTPHGLTYRDLGSYYLVGEATPGNPSFGLLARTELYRPCYLKARDIRKLLSEFYEPYVQVDSASNCLALSGSPQMIEQLEATLAILDQSPRQVMIEVMVTEVSEDNLKEFGLDGYFHGAKDGRIAKLNLPLGGVSDSSITVTGTRKGDSWNGWGLDYGVALRALFMDGKVNVRANPKLATVESQTARIFVGKDEYHSIVTGREPYVYTRLEMIKVGIALEITPYVGQEGDITVDVHISVSDVTGMGVTGLPVVSSRDVRTKITVKDGESIVIGGLQNDAERTNEKKLPILGDIPILGALFRSTSIEKRTTNVIIVITPRLIETHLTDG